MRYFLELCLKSVQEAVKNIDAEIIVVDNHSDDASCKMVKNLFSDVILIENNENFGFSKGNNIGVSKAKGEYICILNPDTVVPEDGFEKLLQFSKGKENLGIVGCKLINGHGAYLPESKREIPFVRAAVKKILGNPEDYYTTHLGENETGKVSVLVGAFMFMKRTVYNNVKGFDEDYFMYGEDIDLSYKVLKAGFVNYYFGEMTIIHYKGESTLRDTFYAKRFYGAMQIFYKKHFKKNHFFNFMVWLGIRLVYLFRRTPVSKNKTVDRYLFVSNKLNPKLETVLNKEVAMKRDLDTGVVLKNTEIILDANMLSYKKIIDIIENTNRDKSITFKILPKNSNFIIGSDNAIARGEILNFD